MTSLGVALLAVAVSNLWVSVTVFNLSRRVNHLAAQVDTSTRQTAAS